MCERERDIVRARVQDVAKVFITQIQVRTIQEKYAKCFWMVTSTIDYRSIPVRQSSLWLSRLIVNDTSQSRHANVQRDLRSIDHISETITNKHEWWLLPKVIVIALPRELRSRHIIMSFLKKRQCLTMSIVL